MFMIIKTIMVNQLHNFEVKNIDEALLSENRMTALCKIIFTYRDIIVQHRTLNEKRANAYKWSLYGISTTLICTFLYITVL